MKDCNNCHQSLPLISFYRNRRNPDGLQRACIPCCKGIYKKWSIKRTRDPIKCRAYYQANKERIKAKTRDWERLNADRKFASDIKSKFDLSIDRYAELLHKQNKVCAICGFEETGKSNNGGHRKRLCVDHCHKTGMVRGLLCNSCNRSLGLLKDNPAILIRAALYLKNSTKVVGN